MNLDYSTFLETYTRADKNNLEKAVDSSTPWLLNNSVYIVLVLFVVAIITAYYMERTKRVAKDDKELMEKYIFLKRKGVI